MNGRAPLRRGQVDISLVVLFQCLWRLCLEGRLARQTLIHDRTDGPEIGFAIVLQRSNHFWRHVHRRTAQCSCHDTIGQEPRESKIRYFQYDILNAWIVLVRM